MRKNISTLKYRKAVKRQRILHRQKQGFLKFKSDVRRLNPDVIFFNYPFYEFKQKSSLTAKPELSQTLQYFINRKDSFAKDSLQFTDSTFKIPKVFSIVDAYSETTIFLKKLFNTLNQQSFKDIKIDYSECEHIGICASMCMDIILSEFIKYFNQLTRGRHTVRIDTIQPINFERDNIKKILFSIGAYRTIKGVKIDFDGVKDFPILIGNKKNPNIGRERELNITKTVDYILECLKSMEKTLTGPAETNLYKVIGEVLQNADEHSDTDYRYSIGYFEENGKTQNNYGIFNLAILNFGNTFYETFKNEDCQNKHVVKQMKDLSKKYTRLNLFDSDSFKEESLWTLYALQDGVTRIADWDRGNGAIRFIESFFKLKGDEQCDNVSKMTLTSGRTRIIFDGSYKIVEKERGSNNKKYKMMTFNDTGNIEEKPDSKFVRYEKNYFPGTMLSAKIRIDFNNTENI